MKAMAYRKGNNRKGLIIPFYSPIIPPREVHLTRGNIRGKNVLRSSPNSPVRIVAVSQ